MKKLMVLLGLTCMGAAVHVNAQGSSSVNCWASDGSEACQSSFTNSNNQVCTLDPAGAEKPKVKKVSSSGRRRVVDANSEDNCRYRCPDGSTPYPDGQQGVKPDTTSQSCEYNPTRGDSKDLPEGVPGQPEDTPWFDQRYHVRVGPVSGIC